MAAWATVSDYVADLRRYLNDSPVDKPVKGKKVLGDADGVKAEFMTFDDRLVADSLTVLVRGQEIPVEEVTVLDLLQGRFLLTNAPPAGAEVQARYYYQDFLDVELEQAAELAADAIVPGTDDITFVERGFKLPALAYGAHFAWAKLAGAYARRRSDRFLLEEAPVDNASIGASVNLFRDLSRDALNQSIRLRDDAIQGSGRRATPSFRVVYRKIPQVGPYR